MNVECTNKGGWHDSKMRKVYMKRFLKLLPLDLRDLILEVGKPTSAGGESIVISNDKLFLPSEVEITGDNDYSVKGEGEQYAYFKNGGEMAEKWQWLRSPYVANSNYFCSWNNYGYVYNSNANSGNSVPLCFCL